MIGLGVCLAVPVLAAESPSNSGTNYVPKTIPILGAKKNPLELRNYPRATNVSLARLVAFVRASPVNRATFEPGKFECTEFAQALHNSAEAAGLRCGLAAVKFETGQGHVLNLFETTDHGLVYVDCTGADDARSPREEFDTFGYLQVGKPYGRLQLDLGLPDPNHYAHYEKICLQRVQVETGLPALARERRQLVAEDRALAKEEQVGAGPELRQRRAALDRKNQELRQRNEELQALAARLRGRIYHSNPAPVKSLRTFW